MSKQYAHLHAMAKTSGKFQNDWPKTVGGVALTSQLLTNGRVTARLYRTCVLQQKRKNLVWFCRSFILLHISEKKWSRITLMIDAIRFPLATLCII